MKSILHHALPLLLLPAVALTGCGGSTVLVPDTRVCRDDAVPGSVSVFAPGVGPTEGIAFLDGQLYVAGGDGLRRIAADGSATLFADVPATVGMVAWNGALYVASGSDGGPSEYCSPTNQGAVWKVTPQGEASVFARGFGSPNFLAVTPWNTLFVSDACRANRQMYEVDASGKTSVWGTEIFSANGMGFDRGNQNLLVVNTFTRVTALYRVPVGADHAPGAAATVASFPSGSTPDGLALDKDENVYVALNIVGTIQKVSPDGTSTAFATGLTTPASMAFGNGPGFDPCSMYVTSLSGDDVSRVAVGTTGLPLLD